MSEAVADPGLLAEALSILHSILGILLGCLFLLGMLTLGVATVGASAGILCAVTRLSPNEWSEEDLQHLITCDSALFAIFFLIVAGTGVEKYWFLEGCWHALGVGCILYGLWIAVEAVVMGLYFCCVRIARRKRDVKKRTFADIEAHFATRKDRDRLERSLSV
jgi:hypothetical protein